MFSNVRSRKILCPRVPYIFFVASFARFFLGFSCAEFFSQFLKIRKVHTMIPYTQAQSRVKRSPPQAYLAHEQLQVDRHAFACISKSSLLEH